MEVREVSGQETRRRIPEDTVYRWCADLDAALHRSAGALTFTHSRNVSATAMHGPAASCFRENRVRPCASCARHREDTLRMRHMRPLALAIWHRLDSQLSHWPSGCRNTWGVLFVRPGNGGECRLNTLCARAAVVPGTWDAAIAAGAAGVPAGAGVRMRLRICIPA